MPTHHAQSEEPTASGHYAVRVGVHGQVGRFMAFGQRYRRGTPVICRTARGLETGSVLSELRSSLTETSVSSAPSEAAESASSTSGINSLKPDGQIVRAMAAEDQLLWNHLRELAEQTLQACQQWLKQSDLPDRLLEVEPLMDGRTLYFHFLDQVSPETDAQIERFAQIFQETVAASDFSKLLEHGCGPGCGTAEATRGCGTACSHCQVACKASRRSAVAH
ncbi:MAG: hypothetical protein IT423_18345 [Pirellulaceae bacterium]|nr:hypothetical protein [Pirellulaceae bacterium]